MESTAKSRPAIIASALIAIIQVYRRFLSPILPAACRFTPSCSAYAQEALQVHGGLRGSWLLMRRLLRCHPGTPGGWDPVPPRSGESKGILDGPANHLRVSSNGSSPDRLSGDLPRSGEAYCR